MIMSFHSGGFSYLEWKKEYTLTTGQRFCVVDIS